MAKPKSVTISLTTKQREQLRSLTGEDHTSVKFEGTKTALSAKVAPRALTMKRAMRPGLTITSPGGQQQMLAKTAPRMVARAASRLATRKAMRAATTFAKKP